MPSEAISPMNISVLICLSGSPSNQKVIRAAAKFARNDQKDLVAVYVDNGKNDRNHPTLLKNIELAESLGASVKIISQKDVLEAITDYARQTAVTDLFIGYSGPSRSTGENHLGVYRLVHSLPEVDVHIIPDAKIQLAPSKLDQEPGHRFNLRDLLVMTAVMAGATAISFLIDRSRFSNSNIVTVYILAVLITSVLTAERMYGIIASVLYILLFNFLFIEPRFSLLVYDPYYMVTYLVSVIAAVITGNVSARMKQSTSQAMVNAYQAQVLLNTSEQLQRAEDSREIADITTGQLHELLQRDIVFFPVKSHALEEEIGAAFSKDKEAIEWTLTHNQRSGFGTSHFPEAEYQYLSVRTGTDIYGIIGVSAGRGELTQFEENILLSIIGECALSLEGEKNREEREEAQIVAENERFRSKLLRSISHDLRTPLTSISGNAANLLSHAEALDEEDKQSIYHDIYEDTIWLIDLVENLLSITRLEESVEIHPVPEVVSDLLETAVNASSRYKRGHHIVLETDEECLMAMMDVPLILQVVSNLISNAIKHTPEDTVIRVRDWQLDDKILISVSDNGPGIPDEEKPHIFDLLYVGKDVREDSSRSLGLGLNLCKSILEAHGQTIRVEDTLPHGTTFIFTLDMAQEVQDGKISDPDR